MNIDDDSADTELGLGNKFCIAVAVADDHMSRDLECKTLMIDACCTIDLDLTGSSCMMEFVKRSWCDSCELVRVDNGNLAEAPTWTLEQLLCNDIPSLASRIAGKKWWQSMAMSS